MRRWAWGSLVVGWAACTIPEEDYPTVAADDICQQWRRCDRGAFEQSYATVSECANDPDGLSRAIETQLDLVDLVGCTYDASEAAGCLRDLRDEACSDFTPLAWVACEAWVCE